MDPLPSLVPLDRPVNPTVALLHRYHRARPVLGPALGENRHCPALSFAGSASLAWAKNVPGSLFPFRPQRAPCRAPECQTGETMGLPSPDNYTRRMIPTPRSAIMRGAGPPSFIRGV
jgi:hypothetical protein